MSRIDSIIETAKSYLGTTEGSSKHKEIIDLYNKARYSDAYQMTMNDPWCCAFVVAVFEKCGMTDIIPCYAYCDGMISIFKKWNRFYSKSARSVVAGDIIFYNWNGDSIADHVGIVTQNMFGKLSVIEGNKSDSVCYRTINSLDSCIIGYGVPNYSVSESNKQENNKQEISSLDREYIRTLPLLKKGSKGIYVKILQILINYYFLYDLDIDGDFGELTTKSILEIQKNNNLEVDGIVGTETWTFILIFYKK